MQITAPTPIQQETIPLAIEGFDILASAQTGSGKTIAYLLPAILKLAKDPQSTALILAPTRELAAQVHQALMKLQGNAASLKAALLIGGASMFNQLRDLRKKPRIIIGTPGRITDHLMRRTLSLGSVRFLIIDEADRMLDMGFGVQLDKIAEFLPQTRQTLMFSATLPPNIVKLSNKYLRDPKRVSIDSSKQEAPKIKQDTLHISTSEKRAKLTQELDQRQGSIIIFVKTKRRAESLAEELREKEYSADAIHGDLSQRQRDRAIQGFRNSKCRIIVATDVAARGLDIPHVMHVINYDLPDCPEDYVHRIGRTGRAGAEGFAMSFISPEERHKWRAIAQLLKIPFTDQGGGGRLEPGRRPYSSQRRRPGGQKRAPYNRFR